MHDLENRLQLCRQEGRELDLQKAQVSDKLAAAEMVGVTHRPYPLVINNMALQVPPVTERW